MRRIFAAAAIVSLMLPCISNGSDIRSMLIEAGKAFEGQARKANLPNLNDFSFVLLRDGVELESGHPVGAFWLLYRYEFRHSQGGGGAKIEGTALVSIVPSIVDGKLKVKIAFRALDVRKADWGVGALAGGEDAALDKLREHLPTAEALAAQFGPLLEKEVAGRAIFPAVPGVLYLPALSSRDIALTLFPLSAGVDPQGGGLKYAAAEVNADRAGDAALILILARESDLNHLAWRRPEDIGGEIVKDEINQAGRHLIIMYLRRGDCVPNLRELKVAGHDWENAIGSVLVLPGPRYAGEKSELWGNGGYKNRQEMLVKRASGDHGGILVMSAVETISLEVRMRDVLDPHAKDDKYLMKAVSSILVAP